MKGQARSCAGPPRPSWPLRFVRWIAEFGEGEVGTLPSIFVKGSQFRDLAQELFRIIAMLARSFHQVRQRPSCGRIGQTARYPAHSLS